MSKLYISGGHGGKDSGAVAQGYKEKFGRNRGFVLSGRPAVLPSFLLGGAYADGRD